MRIVDVPYTHDGLELVGQLAFDETGAEHRPAVLVAHEGDGLGAFVKQRAVRLAELGFVTFALDYYGGGRPLPPEEIGGRFAALAGDPLRTRAIGQAGLDVLLAHEHVDPARVAAIGHCFGGTLALELARAGADLRAVVGFHSGLRTTRPQDAAQITAAVLVCIGADDPIIPPEDRAAFEGEMRAAGVDWRLHLHGGAVHSFTNPGADGANPALRYDASADARSWRAMLDLFAEVL